MREKKKIEPFILRDVGRVLETHSHGKHKKSALCNNKKKKNTHQTQSLIITLFVFFADNNHSLDVDYSCL